MTDAAPATFSDNPMNPLEVALYEGLADHTRMGLFERLMLEADLYAVPEAGGAGGTPGDDGPKVLQLGEQMILRGVTLNDGRDTVTLFTDPRRAVELFGADTRILAMKGRNLLDILKDTVVLLNPAGGRGLLLNPEQIRAVLAHEPLPGPVRPTGTVELSDFPEAEQPTGLVAALRNLFDAVPVHAVWLARAQWMEAGQLGWYIDVRTTEPADHVRAMVERAISGMDTGGAVIDVAISKPGGPDGIGLRF